MDRFGLKTVFSKLFASVMLTLVLFAAGMIALMHLVHDNSADAKWQVLAQQIVNQIDPFVDELDNAITMQQRLQARFMLAVIKKSFDIFDESLQAKLGLYDRDGHLLIQTEDSDLPTILPEDPSWISRLLPSLSSPAQANVQAIGDRGYTLLYEPRYPPKPSELYAVLNLFTGTLALLVLMTVVLWWIAHSMTWRINRMSQQMLQLGEGNFSVRVPARGVDEISTLAKGFNQAAQKIEQLIEANSLLLAHASHELRTPITRIRLQIEMMEMLANDLPTRSQDKFQKRAQAIKRDLTGLNDLVESILLVSRMDAGHAVEKNETLDLLDVVSQECQHYPEATLFGQSVLIEGQPKLLVHLIRNLLNNALIHGKPPIAVHLYGVEDDKDALTPPEKLFTLKPSFLIDSDVVSSHAATMAHTDSSQSMVHREQDNQSSHSATSTASANELSATTSVNHNDSSDTASNDVSNHDLKSQGSASKTTERDRDNLQAETGTPHAHFDATPATKLKPKASLTDVLKDATAKPLKVHDNVFTKHLRRPKAEAITKPNFAVLAVIDQGSGIALDKRQEIFSPFVRLQQKNKGSGLGLSLVAQIVEAHHGRIFTDVYQGHTRFMVILPASKKPLLKRKAIPQH